MNWIKLWYVLGAKNSSWGATDIAPGGTGVAARR